MAKKYVYADEVMNHLRRTEAEGGELVPIDLTEEYLRRAGQMAKIRATQAGIDISKMLYALNR